MRDYSSNKDSINIKRSDALRYRNAIIKRARRLLSIYGPELSLSEIAKSTGVSRATFYRNFKNKQDLILEIFIFNLNLLENYSHKIDDNKESFNNLLYAAVNMQIKFHSLISYLPKNNDYIYENILRIFEPFIIKAKKNNIISEKFNSSTDIIMITTMLSSVLMNQNQEYRKIIIERAVDIVFYGIAP